MSDKPEPQLRVVDRRWWARQEPADQSEPQPVEAGAKPTYVEELERQLAERSAEIQNYAVEHRRALEEWDQARTRIRRDVAKEVERGKRVVLAELLDVLDNIDRALASAGDAEGSPLHRGIALVRDQFLSTLDRQGVKRIAALGEPFDATRHDAVSTAPVDDPAQDGRVVAVLKEGYAMGPAGEELLRPASVVVGAKA